MHKFIRHITNIVSHITKSLQSMQHTAQPTQMTENAACYVVGVHAAMVRARFYQRYYAYCERCEAMEGRRVDDESAESIGGLRQL
jgi:hypothetical protein